MAQPPQLREYVQRAIREGKAARGLTYGDLSAALGERGFPQSATNLGSKVGRGVMSAQLFLAIMKVLGEERIDLTALHLPRTRSGNPSRARTSRKSGDAPHRKNR